MDRRRANRAAILHGEARRRSGVSGRHIGPRAIDLNDCAAVADRGGQGIQGARSRGLGIKQDIVEFEHGLIRRRHDALLNTVLDEIDFLRAIRPAPIKQRPFRSIRRHARIAARPGPFKRDMRRLYQGKLGPKRDPAQPKFRVCLLSFEARIQCSHANCIHDHRFIFVHRVALVLARTANLKAHVVAPYLGIFMGRTLRIADRHRIRSAGFVRVREGARRAVAEVPNPLLDRATRLIFQSHGQRTGACRRARLETSDAPAIVHGVLDYLCSIESRFIRIRKISKRHFNIKGARGSKAM